MFVRGITSLTNLEQICEEPSKTIIGYVFPEFRTKNDTLSIWQIPDYESFIDAALSIVLPKDDFQGSNFIIIASSILEENSIKHMRVDPNRTCILNCRAVHHDMIDVRVKDVPRILNTYRTVLLQEKQLCQDMNEEINIISWDKKDTERFILKAVKEGRVNLEALSGGMLKAIKKKLEQF